MAKKARSDRSQEVAGRCSLSNTLLAQGCQTSREVRSGMTAAAKFDMDEARLGRCCLPKLTGEAKLGRPRCLIRKGGGGGQIRWACQIRHYRSRTTRHQSLKINAMFQA